MVTCLHIVCANNNIKVVIQMHAFLFDLCLHCIHSSNQCRRSSPFFHRHPALGSGKKGAGLPASVPAPSKKARMAPVFINFFYRLLHQLRLPLKRPESTKPGTRLLLSNTSSNYTRYFFYILKHLNTFI